jgi:hypothetical protein
MIITINKITYNDKVLTIYILVFTFIKIGFNYIYSCFYALVFIKACFFFSNSLRPPLPIEGARLAPAVQSPLFQMATTSLVVLRQHTSLFDILLDNVLTLWYKYR